MDRFHRLTFNENLQHQDGGIYSVNIALNDHAGGGVSGFTGGESPCAHMV